MFQCSKERLRAWLSIAQDVLGDPTADAAPHPADAAPHPHRRPLRWRPARRPGTVSPRPPHCISPVRPGGGVERRDRAAR
jgi:hypothetical protein